MTHTVPPISTTKSSLGAKTLARMGFVGMTMGTSPVFIDPRAFASWSGSRSLCALAQMPSPQDEPQLGAR